MSATWKLAPGEALRVKLVRILEPHESLGSPLLVLLVWEERPVCGYVGNEPCRNEERTSNCCVLEAIWDHSVCVDRRDHVTVAPWKVRRGHELHYVFV